MLRMAYSYSSVHALFMPHFPSAALSSVRISVHAQKSHSALLRVHEAATEQ